MRTVIAAIVIAVTTLLAACTGNSQVEEPEQRVPELDTQATATTAAAPRDVTGTLVAQLGSSGIGCYTKYNDRVKDGDHITILDGRDTALAIGTLTDQTIDDVCTFRFILPGIPANEGFYRIRYNDFWWAFNQSFLDKADWTVELDTRG